MTGLKIYLRSKVTQRYRWGQAGVASVLLADGIFEFQWIDAPLYKPLLSFIICGLLILSMTIGNRFRRKFRYLPGVMTILGGATLMFNAHPEFFSTDLVWPVLFYLSGITGILVGLSQFVLDGRRWMTVSKRSVKLKHTMFPMQRYAWEKVKEVVVEDDELIVYLREGRQISVQPERCDIQHLRSKIDTIQRAATSENNVTHPTDLVHDALGMGR